MSTYSRTWFELFLKSIPRKQTDDEVEFLSRQLPVGEFARVLDLGCGTGRHAVPLTRRGYSVTGVDRDADLLAEARLRAKGAATLVESDMRDLAGVPGPVDAVISMWQSFGYFDAATNEAVLQGLVRLLRPGGRLVLDLYNRAFFKRPEGARKIAVGDAYALERWRLRNGRMTVHVDFGRGTGFDVFDWQLYTPEEMAGLLRSMGMELALACSNFDESVPASDAKVRMQLVFERM